MNPRLREAIGQLQRVPRIHFLAALAGVWLVALYFGEWGAAQISMSRCSWPELPIESRDVIVKETRLALVADPQIIDENTYPDRPGWLLKLSIWLTDRYLAKHWRLLDSVVDPDSYVFLGDLFDGGREWKEDKWMEELERWDKIYQLPRNKRVFTNIPGNHDVGFGEALNMDARHRFEAIFGASNNIVELDSHELVFFDSPSLADLGSNGGVTSASSFNFLKVLELKKAEISLGTQKTRILFTHVPLFRSPSDSCGAMREKKKALPFNRGHQYMTQLEPSLTEAVLRMIQPDVIFTGDDHDFCFVEHTHSAPNGDKIDTPEFTIKSASMAMGIHRPATQLLSLGSDGSWATNICYQADPFHPILAYSILAVISIGLMLLRAWSVSGNRNRSTSVGSLPTTEYSALDKPERRRAAPTLLIKQAGGDFIVILAFSIGFLAYSESWMYTPL